MKTKLPKDLTLTVEFYEEDGQNYIFVEEDNSTGFIYEVETVEDVADCVKDYLDAKAKEMKVFVVEVDDVEGIDINKISDEKFIEIAEENGSVYTLKDFERAFNREDVCTIIDFIRFIEV